MNIMTFTPDQNKAPGPTATFSDFQGSFYVSPENTAVSGTTAISVTIPESFLKGLADCDAGRVVDMEKAMEEPPSDSD